MVSVLQQTGPGKGNSFFPFNHKWEHMGRYSLLDDEEAAGVLIGYL